VLGATALGCLAALAASTTPGGRSLLRTRASEFRSTDEGRQALQLLRYLVLALVISVVEAVTGTRGCLTLVYLAIAGTQLLAFARRIPGPEEARARVAALEAGTWKPGQPFVYERKEVEEEKPSEAAQSSQAEVAR